MREKILNIVRDIGRRASDLQRFEAIRSRPFWIGYDFANGWAGICPLLGELDRLEPEAGWDELGHELLQAMQKEMAERQLPSLSLWLGAAGVAMAVRSLSRGGTRYVQFTDQLHGLLLRSLDAQLQEQRGRLGHSVQAADFELVLGMSGVGRYLLLSAERPEMKAALLGVLDYLVALTKPVEVEGVEVPGWYIRFDQLATPAERHLSPQGHLNLGLSHGIPGVLGLLALALEAGIEVPGQREAIDRIADWLIAWRQTDETGSFWPTHVTWEDLHAGRVLKPHYREGWCYGAPGVARTLWLAGRAVGRSAWQELAVESYRETFRRPEALWDAPKPNFCHGRAGLLHLTAAMAADSGAGDLAAQADRLREWVLDKYAPDSVFGYGEEAGLLNGAAGIALVLLGTLGETSTDWDTAFLIR
ncbi:lanthionine synthetase-like protein [Tumebacillus sp. BK434]|uniref:lanthionine synthetase C family protein n=1 Tax=Tumebacillus sp. BK434 TaxID=2512169 RepID=UPI0010DC94A1|nr:lanthionine synthetase C family protein [Tumebacillus sp. BK434]TCP58214.1 lanthionine synthetase-like protein [Tumebacillus sp. BK434]